jgi:hypothetical protein
MSVYCKDPITCTECGFTTTDVPLYNNHSCDVQQSGGRCEDYPCCGHEAGDCNGLLYGSDAAIKSDPHLLCDHNTGICEVEDYEPEDDDSYDEQAFEGVEY